MPSYVLIFILVGTTLALSDFQFAENPYLLLRARALADEKQQDDLWPGNDLKTIEERADQFPPPSFKLPLFSFSFPEEQNVPSDFGVNPFDTKFYQPAPPLYDYESIEKKEDVEVVTELTTEEVTDSEPQVYKTPLIDFNATKEDVIFVALVAGCSAAAVLGVGLLSYGIYRLQKSSKAAADVEYPAYGVTGPNKEATPTGDRRLAHSAQMYHYQLTKQQIIAMERDRGTNERRGSVSDADSDDENEEEGDYTVYECPGLAPTGEMEVKNPMFQDDPTPASTILDQK